MRVRTVVALSFLLCALPLAADDSDRLDKLLTRAAENAARGGTGGTIQFNAKDGPEEILAFSWGVSNSGSFTGGGGAGKANFQDFSFVKRFEKSSPVLVNACATGQHYPTVTVTLKDRRGNTYLVMEFKEVMVTSYQTGGSSSDTIPMDAITLNYSAITMNGTAMPLPSP